MKLSILQSAHVYIRLLYNQELKYENILSCLCFFQQARTLLHRCTSLPLLSILCYVSVVAAESDQGLREANTETVHV